MPRRLCRCTPVNPPRSSATSLRWGHPEGIIPHREHTRFVKKVAHEGQRRIGARAHVQRLGSEPGRVDADHLRSAAAQLAHSAAALTGQVTTIDNAPQRNSTLISRGSGCDAAEGSCSGMNAARGRSHLKRSSRTVGRQLVAPAALMLLEPAVQLVGIHCMLPGQACDGNAGLPTSCYQLALNCAV